MPPLPSDMQPDLPPLPTGMAAPAPGAPQPALRQKRWPLWWGILFAGVAVYGAVDAWQNAKAGESALVEANQCKEAAAQSSENEGKTKERMHTVAQLAAEKGALEAKLLSADNSLKMLRERRDTLTIAPDVERLQREEASLQGMKETLEKELNSSENNDL